MPAADELYRVEGLTIGDYDIRVKWSYAPYACPTQLDDINIRIKNPTNSGLRANYYCVDNRLRLSETSLPGDIYKFQYRRLVNSAWTGWITTNNSTNGSVNINNLAPNTTAVKYRVQVNCDNIWSGWGQQKQLNIPNCKLGSDLSVTFKVYPNPATDIICVELHNINYSQGAVMIFSLTGKLLKQINIIDKTIAAKIDVSDLHDGMYLLHIFMGNSDQTLTDKITIAR